MQPTSDKTYEEIMGIHATWQRLASPSREETPDQIQDCVWRLITIAHGEDAIKQKLSDAETQISELLLANAEAGGWSTILQLLVDQLKIEIKLHRGATQEFLANVIQLIDRHLERSSRARAAIPTCDEI
jgi:hypothetical protein